MEARRQREAFKGYRKIAVFLVAFEEIETPKQAGGKEVSVQISEVVEVYLLGDFIAKGKEATPPEGVPYLKGEVRHGPLVGGETHRPLNAEGSFLHALYEGIDFFVVNRFHRNGFEEVGLLQPLFQQREVSPFKPLPFKVSYHVFELLGAEPSLNPENGLSKFLYRRTADHPYNLYDPRAFLLFKGNLGGLATEGNQGVVKGIFNLL